MVIPPGQYAAVTQLLDEIVTLVNRNLAAMTVYYKVTNDIKALVADSRVFSMNEFCHASGIKVIRIGVSETMCKALGFKFYMHQTLQFQLGFNDYLAHDISWLNCKNIMTTDTVGRNP